MSDFDPALDHVLRWEGGYTDDEADSGGRTTFGISEAAHPEAWRDGPPTREQAERIYRNEYWQELSCGEIEDQKIAQYVFDAGVNLGVHTAARMLQKACNLLEQDIRVDGLVGPKTLRAVNHVEAKRLLYALIALRASEYVGIADQQSSQRRFLYGWLRRAFDPLTP